MNGDFVTDSLSVDKSSAVMLARQAADILCNFRKRTRGRREGSRDCYNAFSEWSGRHSDSPGNFSVRKNACSVYP